MVISYGLVYVSPDSSTRYRQPRYHRGESVRVDNIQILYPRVDFPPPTAAQWDRSVEMGTGVSE